MSAEYFKISVLVVTYNHEDFLADALDSVLDEEILPDELVISDDASTDGTLDIARHYQNKFPDLVRIVVNSKNKGLYAHFQETPNRVKGDVVCYLAGDDLFAPKAIASLRKELSEAGVAKDEAFLVVTNYQIFQENGLTRVFDNYALRNKSPLAMRLRGDFSHRNFGLSKTLMERWPLFTDLAKKYPDLGYSLDLVRGIHEILNVDRFIFANFVSSLYRTGVGVTSQTVTHNPQGFFRAMDIITSNYCSCLTKADLNYINFRRAVCRAHIEGTPLRYVYACVLLLRNARNLSPNRGFLWHAALLLSRDSRFFVRLRQVRGSLLGS